MAALLGLDIGTTSIKAAVYDPDLGQVSQAASRPTPVRRQASDRSEHDPEALWQAVLECIRDVAAGQPVAGLAISSMAEAGVLVDAEGRPVAPVMAWYDRRSEPQAAQVEAAAPMERLYAITGQRASPSFGATKLLWLRDNRPEDFRRGQTWLPVPAYVLYRLTGQMAVDYTIASRTLLFDQQRRAWSSELLEALRLQAGLLPPVRASGSAVGALTPAAAAASGLPAGAVCVLGGHDHLCASLAAGARHPGALSDSTGSANALMLLLPGFLDRPALAERGYACYAYLVNDLYVLKGGLKAAGSALEWLARLLSAGGAPDYPTLEVAAAAGVGRRAGPLWLPHLIGSGTPQGDRFSRAALAGARFEHGPGDLFRGLLESLACWLRHNLEEMQALTGLAPESVILTGGATRLRLLSQLKADVLNRPVRVPQLPEAAACGAALLAGLGAGVFHTVEEALGSLRYAWEDIDPDPRRAEWYGELYRAVYTPLYQALRPANLALELMDKRAGQDPE
jgi:xylulokinase